MGTHEQSRKQSRTPSATGQSRSHGPSHGNRKSAGQSSHGSSHAQSRPEQSRHCTPLERGAWCAPAAPGGEIKVKNQPLELPRLSTSSLEAERYEWAARNATKWLALEAGKRYLLVFAAMLRDDLRTEMERIINTAPNLDHLQVRLDQWSHRNHGMLAEEIGMVGDYGSARTAIVNACSAASVTAGSDWVTLAIDMVRSDDRLQSAWYVQAEWRIHTHVQAAWDVCNTGPLPPEVASLPPGPEPVEPPAPF